MLSSPATYVLNIKNISGEITVTSTVIQSFTRHLLLNSSR